MLTSFVQAVAAPPPPLFFAVAFPDLGFSHWVFLDRFLTHPSNEYTSLLLDILSDTLLVRMSFFKSLNMKVEQLRYQDLDE